jgi:putative ABC transport system permease protein
MNFVLRQPWDLVTLGALVGLAVVVGLCSGAYPAAVLSGFQPMAVLRDRLSLGWSAGTLRKGLVVVQFALAIVLMTGVYVLHEQLQFATNPDAPYPAERMLVIESAPRDFSAAGFRRIQTARDRIAALPGVEGASVSFDIPEVGSGTAGAGLRRPEWPSSRTVEAGRYRVDAHFDEAYDLTVTKGRFFREPLPNDSATVVVNEAAVEQLEMKRPVGTELEWVNVGTVTVIGVVENFNLQNARAGLHPVVLTPLQPGDWYRSMSVRLAAGAPGGLDAVRDTWADVLPDTPFAHVFLDHRIAEGYRAEHQTRRLVGAGAGLALFVALLGLIGLTGFTVRRRTTEIGIRKALGATVTGIVRLLSRDVAKLIGIAFLVGAPVAYLLTWWWLQDFARRIVLTPWPFLAVGAAALICALAAVSVHTIRAARVDPARTLRSE